MREWGCLAVACGRAPAETGRAPGGTERAPGERPRSEIGSSACFGERNEWSPLYPGGSASCHVSRAREGQVRALLSGTSGIRGTSGRRGANGISGTNDISDTSGISGTNAKWDVA